MSLVSHYSDIPISGRYGNGSYTYKCVIETEELGIQKVEIFAIGVEQAMSMVAMLYGCVVDYSYVNPKVISIVLASYPNATCLLWTD